MEENKTKKIMTVAGHYSTRNYTVADIQSFKGKRQLTKTLPFTEEEAAAAEQAGIETLNIRHNPERPELSKALRDAAPDSFMSFALPMQSAKSEYDALKLSFDAMELGADSIICGTWGLRFIEAVAHAGIPTEGHIGLVPRKSTWTGGFKAVGKTIEQAKSLYEDLKTLENIGAWAVEIEVIPENIMALLSPNTSLITSSIGSGKGDIQFLFAEDILGDSEGDFPRHSKQYADLYRMRKKMQDIRIEAFQHFIDDVKLDEFPNSTTTVTAAHEVVTELESHIAALKKP
jgi:3-methyl-2-oxobutanoate hydroxymethyltransferase